MGKFLKKYQITLFLLAALAIYFSFGFFHIDKFETADEHYWISDPYDGRIHEYWEAIAKRKWKNTYINDKPGITLAYVSGIALFFEGDAKGKTFQEEKGYRVYDPAITRKLDLLYRTPLLIFNGLFALVLFWLLKRMTEDGWIALWSVIFMFLSPILLGVSQIVNPDALLWEFSAAAIFSFWAFLKTEEKKFVALTGLFLGLSLLTKYVSIILLPFFMAMIALYYLMDSEGDLVLLTRRMLKAYAGSLLAILGAAVLFSLLLPATFLQPKSVLGRTFADLDGLFPILAIVGAFGLFLAADFYLFQSKLIPKLSMLVRKNKWNIPSILLWASLVMLLFTLFNWMFSRGVMRGVRLVPFDIGRGEEFGSRNLFERIVLECYPIVFSLTPMVLFGWLWSIRKAVATKETRHRSLVVMLMVFVIAFIAALLFQELMITTRYGIVLYPLIAVMAAVGLGQIVDKFHWNKALITVVFVAISGVSLWSIKPFYFNYANTLLHSDKSIADAWGYGGYEAAEYLNALPDAKNLLVWSDYNGFCQFFVGKCAKGRKDFQDTAIKKNEIPDYFVRTRRGSIMYQTTWYSIEDSYIDTENPVWKLLIDGKEENFVKVYKRQQGM